MPHFQIFQSNRWRWVLPFALSVMLLFTVPAWAAATSQPDLQQLDTYIEQAIAKVEAQDLAGAATTYNQFRESWFDVEDGIKDSSQQAYREIEDAMGNVKFALSAEPSNRAQLEATLKELHATNQKFIAGRFSSAQTAPSTSSTSSSNSVTIASLAERLNRAEAALQIQDIATATNEVKSFQTDWVEVEGFVAGKSRQAYIAIENNMATAYAALRSTPPQVGEAKAAIATLKTDLQPFAEKSLHYSLFDSAVILLREGMEALLVLVALCAFLVKSNNGDKSRWIWIGAGAGILASVITALVIHLVFANIAVGSNRELLEGLTGLVAAAMLFYVSYWLHSKSSMGAWQVYIKEKTTTALAQNSVFSLALLAFLAVFREGAETVLFYIGIAPSISTADLLGGLGLGSLILVVVAVLMLGLGLRIPLQPFFLFTSLLIYYLGFKFVGSGIHALQVAGLLPADTASFLPSVAALGLYPTWETTLVQLAIFVIAIGVVLYNRSRTPSADA